MSNRPWLRWSLGGLTVAGLAWGCREVATAIPGYTASFKPSFNASSPPAFEKGELVVCKDTPAGTSGQFQIEVVGILFMGINSGQCEQVLVTGSVAVRENPETENGWHLVSVTKITSAGHVELFTPFFNPISCSIDANDGCLLIFHNAPDTPPPPPGKTFSIGPSSMEGAILISNGDWVNGGYSFKFVSGSHAPTDFSVHATVSLAGPCIGGGPATDTFTFPLNDATYAVPAGNTDWLPTADANSVLSWEGSVVATGVCDGVGKLDARHGAVFTATVSQNPSSGSLVDFRFKYRDPAAKGKPNTNCLDTSDPNRAKADVCGASWSQTVRDP